mgnify:CR=1 FL=1
MSNIVKSAKEKIDEISSMVNWNYVGLAAALLSIVVTVRNINSYLEEIKTKGGKENV